MSGGFEFEDFIVPLIIGSPEEFKPREAKAKFAKICSVLAKQAFCLELFRFLEKHKDSVAGIEFSEDNAAAADDQFVLLKRAGSDHAKFERALNASKKVFSQARGKLANNYHFAGIKSKLPKVVSLENKEEVLVGMLGQEFYGMRRSTIESKEMSAALTKALVDAVSGGSSGSAGKGPSL